MSGDEDTELRDLVAQTLEANGVLGRIRAELRASIFLALEDQEAKNKTPLVNSELLKFLSTAEGCQTAGLVREFLQLFGLDYTLAVFDQELGCTNKLPDRASLGRSLNLVMKDDLSSNQPLLVTLVKRHSSLAGSNASILDLDKGPAVDVATTKYSAGANNSEAISPTNCGISLVENMSSASTKEGSSKDSMIQSDRKSREFGHTNSASAPVGAEEKNASQFKMGADSYEEEEIVEELSNIDDLLSDRSSRNGELTTDRTISSVGQSDALDYMEDVLRA